MGKGNAMGRRRKKAPLMNMESNYRVMNNKVVTLRGSDYISDVIVDPTILNGAGNPIRAVIPVSPSEFTGTRLTALSQLWERYRFRSFKVRYVPAVPNTLGAQFVLYLDTDPSDDPSGLNFYQLVRQAVAQTGAQQWSFNKPKTIELAKRQDDQMYYTGVDKQNKRFSQQATAYLLQVTDVIDFNGGPLTSAISCGSLFIDWEVEFQTPQINPSALISTSPFVGQITFRNSNNVLTGNDTFQLDNLNPGAKYRIHFNPAFYKDTAVAIPLGFTYQIYMSPTPDYVPGTAQNTGWFINNDPTTVGSTYQIVLNENQSPEVPSPGTFIAPNQQATTTQVQGTVAYFILVNEAASPPMFIKWTVVDATDYMNKLTVYYTIDGSGQPAYIS